MQLYITAVAQNAEALRFYEREGFTPAFVVLRDTRPDECANDEFATASGLS